MELTRIFIIILMGFVISALLTFIEIPVLSKKQFKQYIREEGPKSHLKKQGTPTMGGIAIIIAIILTTLLSGGVSGRSAAMMLSAVFFGLIGFLDDYIKVAEKHNLGLRAWQKIVLQVAFSLGIGIYMARYSGVGTEVYIPFANKYVDFGSAYIPFVMLVIVAVANSVNLSDGLDGLSSGVTAIVSFFFAIAGMMTGFESASAFSAVISGVCLGFLVFNRHPAKLFMGDTGSMALGGALAVAAIMMKMEFMLIIAGFIYVLESLSVIIQVISFKTTGKRVFKMSPIHHHFEMCGMKEQNVVFMFWGIAAACSLLAYLVLLI